MVVLAVDSEEAAERIPVFQSWQIHVVLLRKPSVELFNIPCADDGLVFIDLCDKFWVGGSPSEVVQPVSEFECEVNRMVVQFFDSITTNLRVTTECKVDDEHHG